jgi:hypothetical protein
VQVAQSERPVSLLPGVEGKPSWKAPRSPARLRLGSLVRELFYFRAPARRIRALQIARRGEK